MARRDEFYVTLLTAELEDTLRRIERIEAELNSPRLVGNKRWTFSSLLELDFERRRVLQEELAAVRHDADSPDPA